MKCVHLLAGFVILSQCAMFSCARSSKRDISLGMMAEDRSAATAFGAETRARYAKLPGFTEIDPKDSRPLTADPGKEAMMNIKGGGRAFTLVFGGSVSEEVNAPAEGHLDGPDPNFQLDSNGFVVAAGWRPFVSTPIVDAGSEGTVMIVYQENVGQTDVLNRIFLIEGGPIRIMPATENSLCPAGFSLQTVSTFVECTLNLTNGCVNFSAPMAIPAPSSDPAVPDHPVRAFVDHVLGLDNVEELINP